MANEIRRLTVGNDDWQEIQKAATEKQMSAITTKHQAWRDRINEIEDEIAALDVLEPEDETPAPEAEV